MRKSFYGTDYDSISRKPVNKYDLIRRCRARLDSLHEEIIYFAIYNLLNFKNIARIRDKIFSRPLYVSPLDKFKFE